MDYPKQLLYSKEHEWLDASSGTEATIGVTHFAVEQLGDIVHVDFPKVGDKITEGDSFGTIESTKTVSDLYAPASGTITAVNTSLSNSLDLLSTDPYKGAWLVKISMDSKPTTLMSADQYSKFVQEQ